VKVATALATTVVGAVILGGAYVVSDRVTRQPNTTMTMPKPKRVVNRIPGDDRVYAIIQLCWRPGRIAGTVHFQLGPLERVEAAGDMDCRDPWQRKGLVKAGDRLVVGWAVDPHSALRMVHYRITVDNIQRMDGEDMASSKTYACIVGKPPC
jgi:hypothetical protein